MTFSVFCLALLTFWCFYVLFSIILMFLTYVVDITVLPCVLTNLSLYLILFKVTSYTSFDREEIVPKNRNPKMFIFISQFS